MRKATVMARRNFPFLLRVALVLGGVFAAMDFYPRYGAPYFRYTGADPAHHVWNLGWPFALAIYDSRSGAHIGPFVYVVFPFQFLIVSIVAAAGVLRDRHNTGRGQS